MEIKLISNELIGLKKESIDAEGQVLHGKTNK